jgi:hypothetical protein
VTEIQFAYAYRNHLAGFDVRLVENRGENGEPLEPLHIVELRPDADSPWSVSADSDNERWRAVGRVSSLLKRSTLPPELGG